MGTERTLSTSLPRRPHLFATQPQLMTKVLAITHRVISTDLIHRVGLTVKSGAQTGAVTLIQQFGWYGTPAALNAHRNAAPLHFHMLYVDGVFDHRAEFYPLRSPSTSDLDAITHKIAQRVSSYLERTGYLERDAESAYLNVQDDDEDAMAPIVGASPETAVVRHSGRSYRLAFGPNAGRQALTLQTIPANDGTARSGLLSKISGFSLHAGVAFKAKQRNKLERLCRYVTRPAISEQRLSQASNGNVVYADWASP